MAVHAGPRGASDDRMVRRAARRTRGEGAESRRAGRRVQRVLGVMALHLILSIPARSLHREFSRVSLERAVACAERIEELADWCRGERLYRRRQLLMAFLLELQPDHRAARRELGWRRVNGEWIRSPAWSPARDFAPESLPEALERQRAAVALVRDPFLAALREEPEGLRRESARSGIRALLAIDEDDAALRALLGETRFEDRWVLVESARAATRRTALRDAVRAARVHAPDPIARPVPDDVAAWPVAWTGAFATRDLIVAGDVSTEECAALARELGALTRTFELAFGDRATVRDGLRVYAWSDASARDVAIRELELPPHVGKVLATAAGGWLGDGRTMAQWSADPERRRDGAVRQVLGTLWMDRYGVDGGHAWAWEGFGLYLTHLQLGTRRTWFFESVGYAPASAAGDWQAIQDPTSDWYAMGRAWLTAPDGVRLSTLLGRSLNSMQPRDLVASYVLAAYLLEGHAEATPRVMAGLGRGEHPVTVIERELGLPLIVLQDRVVRWIDETPELVALLERRAADLADADRTTADR